MEYTIEEISPVKRKVSITTPKDEVEASLAATVALYRKSADIKGFRKGKVPSSLIESKYRKQIYSEATTDLVNLHINEIMNELKLTPVSRIDFDGKEVVRGEDFLYAISFEVMPDFDLPPYEGVEVEQEMVEVKEDEVQAVFDRVRDQLAELVDVKEERAPKDDEVALISFKAFENGEPIKGVQADNFELLLGQGQALPEFEEAVKNMTPGERKDQEVVFPEDFLNPDLAGKTVAMKIELHKVKEKVLPEVDDDLAQKAGGFGTVEKMREAITNSYTESRKQLYRSAAQKRLLDGLVAKVEFPLPEAMIEQHQARMLSELRGKLESQGKSLESLGQSEEEIKKGFRGQAEDLVRSEVFLLTLARKESLSVSDQEMDFFFQQMAARSGDDVRELKNFHIQNNLMYAVKDRLLADKAMELLYGKAKVNEVPGEELKAKSGASEEGADQKDDGSDS